MRELVFIINPKSGTDYKIKVIRQIEQFAREGHGFRSEIFLTQHKNHATELAAEAVKNKAEIVVAVGGDGTVNEVAASLKNTDSVLGIIPCGSGNGLARHFGISINPKEALKILEKGHVKTIDSILVNDKFSLNIAGVGFDAHVAGLFASHGKRGLATYSKLALTAFSKYEPLMYTINFGNQVINKQAFLIVFANGSQWGNNAVIAPGASPDSGQITVGILEKLKLSDVPAFIFRLFNGTLHKWNMMSYTTASSIKLSSDRPFPLHIDGEPAGYLKEINITVQPASIKIIVP